MATDEEAIAHVMESLTKMIAEVHKIESEKSEGQVLVQLPPDKMPFIGFDIHIDQMEVIPDITEEERRQYYEKFEDEPIRCTEVGPNKRFVCTRVKGHLYPDGRFHGGPHLAGNGRSIVAAW